jgi:hypothetical protein
MEVVTHCTRHAHTAAAQRWRYGGRVGSDHRSRSVKNTGEAHAAERGLPWIGKPPAFCAMQGEPHGGERPDKGEQHGGERTDRMSGQARERSRNAKRAVRAGPQRGRSQSVAGKSVESFPMDGLFGASHLTPSLMLGAALRAFAAVARRRHGGPRRALQSVPGSNATL